jgi:hypothetical protein
MALIEELLGAPGNFSAGGAAQVRWRAQRSAGEQGVIVW